MRRSTGSFSSYAFSVALLACAAASAAAAAGGEASIRIVRVGVDPLPLYERADASRLARTLSNPQLPIQVKRELNEFLEVEIDGRSLWIDGAHVTVRRTGAKPAAIICTDAPVVGRRSGSVDAANAGTPGASKRGC